MLSKSQAVADVTGRAVVFGHRLCRALLPQQMLRATEAKECPRSRGADGTLTGMRTAFDEPGISPASSTGSGEMRAGPASASRMGRPLLEPVFSGRRRIVNVLGICAWLASLGFLWAWWLQPEHVYTPGRYAAVTATLLWVSLTPAYFIFLFAGARVSARDIGVPAGARIAVVVTKAPSEPFSLVKRTLEGALDQAGIPHDTWLADEDPTPEVLDWCRQNGVQVSTRKGIAHYHRETWPRRTRSKEGNLAYFYDHFGYERYDFVAQFDADHVPSPDYLRYAIAPFADPRVGYVSAPSICDSNAERSWSARGRLHVEASMHGALQTGYNAGWAPLCIGSHYTVRTAALREVGGLGPELAEDHSTTLILNAAGWRGVHAVDAIANGAGPETFADLAVQEFQWSRSLVTILLRYSPTYVPRLPWRLRFQFVFSQLWYPMFSGFMSLMFLMPIFALATSRHYANVNYIDFAIHMLPLSTVLLVLAFWWRSTGLFRPADASVLSWEGIVFLLLRWPWSLMGSIIAVWDRVTGTVAGFRVTPKGAERTALPFRVLAPYLLLAFGAGVVGWAVDDPGTAAGFYIFNLVNGCIYLGLVLLVLWRHARENGLPFAPAGKAGAAVLFSVALIASVIAGGLHANGAKGLDAINRGIKVFTTTETLFPAAGAGRGKPEPSIRFRPRWRGLPADRSHVS